MKTGFYSSKEAFVFYTDGDFQYDVIEIKRLAPKIKNSIDVINGYKIINKTVNFR